MFASPKFHTYLKYYLNTTSATACEDKIDMTWCTSTDLLKKTSGKEVLSSEIINHAVKPQYISSNLYDIPSMEVTAEMTRNQYFCHAVNTLIGDTYKVDPI